VDSAIAGIARAVVPVDSPAAVVDNPVVVVDNREVVVDSLGAVAGSPEVNRPVREQAAAVAGTAAAGKVLDRKTDSGLEGRAATVVDP
jgi:hypothetical protein